MYWRQDAWDAAGLTEADVPQSYTELLDFLEEWMEPANDQLRNRLYVADAQNNHTRWLLDMLINTWGMQQYSAGGNAEFPHSRVCGAT